jgi:hypothetical protein
VQDAFIDPALSLGLRIFLLGLFARSVYGKLRDPVSFRATVSDYELVAASWVTPVSGALIAAESVMLVTLLPSASHVWAARACAVLLLLYSGAIAWNLARGRREIDCGCAGPLAQSGLHEWLVVRNGFYFVFAVTASLPVAARPLGLLDGFTVLLAASTLLTLAVAIDGLATGAARTRLGEADR